MITGALDVMQEPRAARPAAGAPLQVPEPLRENATASTVALVPNTATPPFEDRAVRGAVSESLDGETLARLYNGHLTPTCNLLPESVPGYRRLDPCPHGQRSDPPDLPDAQQQIEKAGATNAPVTVTAGPGRARGRGALRRPDAAEGGAQSEHASEAAAASA